MSYATAANRPKPAAILGSLGVPAGFAVLLITGLTVTGVIETPAPNPTAIFTDPEVIPPVEPEVQPETPSSSTQTRTEQVPDFTNVRPDTRFDFEMGPTAPVGGLPDLGEDFVSPVVVEVPAPRPTPMFEPVSVSPRGNPGEWITDADYRTVWINRGYAGVAGFDLSIDTRGRITQCTITRSTGYSALDDATCRLLERRARFTPARDSSGNVVAGRYRNSVNWTIPE